MGCDKADVLVLPSLEGLKRGYAVVAINYRMSGEAKFPALVHDVKAAIRWIRANAQTYHFDPNRIAAWGGSAGAYLALMLGTSAGVQKLEDVNMGNPNQPSTVQAVVSWFGPSDFLKMGLQISVPWGVFKVSTPLAWVLCHARVPIMSRYVLWSKRR